MMLALAHSAHARSPIGHNHHLVAHSLLNYLSSPNPTVEPKSASFPCAILKGSGYPHTPSHRMMATREPRITTTDYPAEITGSKTAVEIPSGDKIDVVSVQCGTTTAKHISEKVSNLMKESFQNLFSLL